MDQKTELYDFFVNGKLDLRKLRHDMIGAVSIMQNMLDMSAKYPQRRSAEFDPIMQQVVGRLGQIIDSLREKANSDQIGSKAGLVDTVEK